MQLSSGSCQAHCNFKQESHNGLISSLIYSVILHTVDFIRVKKYVFRPRATTGLVLSTPQAKLSSGRMHLTKVHSEGSCEFNYKSFHWTTIVIEWKNASQFHSEKTSATNAINTSFLSHKFKQAHYTCNVPHSLSHTAKTSDNTPCLSSWNNCAIHVMLMINYVTIDVPQRPDFRLL